MAVSADTLRTHLAYTTWASRRLVAAAEQLTPEELNRDFKTAEHSVLGTLVHVFAADRIWMARLTDQPVSSFVTEADHRLSVLQNDWPSLLAQWQRWAAALTDESADRKSVV